MKTFVCKTHEDMGKSEHHIKAVKVDKALIALEAKLGKKIVSYDRLGYHIWYYTR